MASKSKAGNPENNGTFAELEKGTARRSNPSVKAASTAKEVRTEMPGGTTRVDR